MIEWLSTLVVVAGGVYLFLGRPLVSASPGRQAPALMDTVTLESGRVVARLDDDRWRRFCEEADLPAAPPLDGTDPVTARALIETAEQWSRRREPAALGRLGKIYLALEEHEAALQCFAATAQLEPGQ